MKKIVIGLLSLLIVSSVTLVGAYLYSANSITYSNEKLSATNVQSAIEEIYNSLSLPTTCITPTQFHIGDYVRMIPTNTSYTIKKEMTGSSSNRTINPRQLKLWRVINITPCNVEMVSEYVTRSTVCINGQEGYANSIGALNEIANQYQNPKYTIRARHMGYNGQTEYINDTSYFDGTSTKLLTEWTSSTTTTLNQIPANESLGGGDTMYQKDLDLVNNAIGTLNAGTCKNDECNDAYSDGHYWLASRYYKIYSGNQFNFSYRYVNPSGLQESYIRSYDNSNGWKSCNCWGSYSIRPIVTLKSGVVPSSGDGSSGNPYILQ